MQPNVQHAVQEQVRRLTERAEISTTNVIVELARVAFSDMGKLASWGEHGVRLKDSEGLTEDERRSVASVSETITKAGGSVQIKTHGKVEALKVLLAFLEPETTEVDHGLLRAELFAMLTRLNLPDEVLRQIEEA